MIHGIEVVTPKGFREALELRHEYGTEAVPIAGGTDLVVKAKDADPRYRVVIDLTRVEELRALVETEDHVDFGALFTFAELLESPLVATHFPCLQDCAIEVGSPQIRALATLGGNLANASPAGDSFPPLVALGATLALHSLRGVRTVPVEEFFLGRAQTVLREDELIGTIRIPKQGPANAFLRLGVRKSLAISKVSVAVSIPAGNGGKQIRVAFGAVAPTVVRARKIEDTLGAWPVSAERLDAAIARLPEEIRPIADVRSTAEYRLAMAGVYLKRALALAGSRLPARAVGGARSRARGRT